jgi:hypothetical protein
LPAAEAPASLPLPKPAIEDSTDTIHLLPKPKTALSLLGGGFALGFAGPLALEALGGRALSHSGTGALLKDGIQDKESAILYLYNDKLSSLLNYLNHNPENMPKVLGYVAVGGLGYLAASALDGVKEAWVRREETGIRGRLLARLAGTFQESIQLKNRMDDNLRAEGRQRLLQLLAAWQVPQPERFLESAPPDCTTVRAYQHYMVEPTHLEMMVSQTFHGNPNAETVSPEAPGNLAPARRVLQGLLFGLGTLAGVTAWGTVSLLSALSKQPAVQSAVKTSENKTNVSLTNAEAVFLRFSQGRENLPLLAGWFALGALGGLGGALLNGLKAIAVTQANADTELRYQRFNWLALDPTFHGIAEREALNHGLNQLAADLPWLRGQEALLNQRVRATIQGIGLNSPPKYFVATPPVGLVDARS